MSSVRQELPWAGRCNYAASKRGIMMLMKSIARNLHRAPDVDQVVGDDTEANPAVYADIALVGSAAEAVSPFFLR
jgi:hypothetical protein